MKKFLERLMKILLSKISLDAVIELALRMAEKLSKMKATVIDDIAVKLMRLGASIYRDREEKPIRLLIGEALVGIDSALSEYAKQSGTKIDDIALALIREAGKILEQDVEKDIKGTVIQALAALKSVFGEYIRQSETKIDDTILELIDSTIELLEIGEE